tara:strand:+ start:6625 stop:6903 length:279 start_codon:yes stop_codon:yes gene_type:complete
MRECIMRKDITEKKFLPWDKSDWSKYYGQRKRIKSNSFANDDPMAENFDKHGTVFKTYGTLEVSDLVWSTTNKKIARERKPTHQFRKKYHND